jgi:pyruvate,water dikinase
MDHSQLTQIQDGEILVCPITSPNWGPFLSRLKAIVTDIGGIMSHAAIIAREYGVPAVVGTGFGTRVIKTGDRIQVDGTDGKVRVLE